MADGTRLTKFDGRNSESWISNAKEIFEFYRTEDSARITIAAFYFDGKARRWYRWMKSNRQLSCWSHFTKAMRERFPNTDLEPPQGYQSRFETLSNQTRCEENATWNHQFLDIADELIRIGQRYKCSMLGSLDIPQVFYETLERVDDVIGGEIIKEEISAQVETLKQYPSNFEEPMFESMEHTKIMPTIHYSPEFLEESSDASQLFDKMSTRVVDILAVEMNNAVLGDDSVHDRQIISVGCTDFMSLEAHIFLPMIQVVPPWMLGSPSKETYVNGNPSNKHYLSQLMFDEIYAMIFMNVNNYVEIHDPYMFRLLLMGRSLFLGALDVNILMHYMFRLLVMGKLICNVDVEIVANVRSRVVMLHLCLVVCGSWRFPFHEHIVIVNEMHNSIEFMVIPNQMNGTLKELGGTIVILNSLNPAWIEKIDVAYQFEIVQTLVFHVYDVDTCYHNILEQALKSYEYNLEVQPFDPGIVPHPFAQLEEFRCVNTLHIEELKNHTKVAARIYIVLRRDASCPDLIKAAIVIQKYVHGWMARSHNILGHAHWKLVATTMIQIDCKNFPYRSLQQTSSYSSLGNFEHLFQLQGVHFISDLANLELSNNTCLLHIWKGPLQVASNLISLSIHSCHSF